jgi:molybdate transport system substrate-binding protein
MKVNKTVGGGIIAALLALMPWSMSVAAERVTLFAAASLTNAITDVVAAFEQTHAIRVVTSFASSSTLARQIAQGAPADIFLSANQTWMDYLQEQDSIDEASRFTLLGNTLVLVAPKDSPLEKVDVSAKWKPADQLGDDGRLAVGDPDHVPAGRYAKEALEHLGLWAKVKDKLAPSNSVRAALALVERGETPLGIVYGTDARVSSRVKVVGRFSDDSHTPIEYPVAIVKGHEGPEAEQLAQFLQSETASDIFSGYGFEVRSWD